MTEAEQKHIEEQARLALVSVCNEDFVRRFARGRVLPQVVTHSNSRLSMPNENKKQANDYEIGQDMMAAWNELMQRNWKAAINGYNKVLLNVEEPYGRNRAIVAEILGIRESIFRINNYNGKADIDRDANQRYFSNAQIEQAQAGAADPYSHLNIENLSEDELLDHRDDVISPSLELREEEGRGRFFIARDDIEPKSQLVNEKAYATSVKTNFMHNVCTRCIKPCGDQVFPCARCPRIAYCHT